MDQSTASTIGTILGAFAASFTAQMWGNFVTRKSAAKVLKGSAAQTTVDEIRETVTKVDAKTDTLVKQPGVVQPEDHRSPERKE